MPESPWQGGNLTNEAAAAPMVDPIVHMPVSSDRPPSMRMGASESQEGSSPKRRPPSNVGVDSATRRLRTDVPKAVTASLSGQSALGLEGGGFRNEYAFRPAHAPRLRDLDAAMKNPIEGRPDSRRDEEC